MSNTTRKSSNFQTLEYKIKDELSYININPTYKVRLKKTKAEFQQSLLDVQEDYNKRLAEFAAKRNVDVHTAAKVKKFSHMTVDCNFIFRPVIEPRPVKKFKLVDVDFDVSATIAEVKMRHSKRYRDGSCNETGRNKRFKYLTKKQIRNKNKLSCNKILRDVDAYDDMVFMNRRDGKKFIWSVW